MSRSRNNNPMRRRRTRHRGEASANAASRTGAEQRLVFPEDDAVEGDEHDRRGQRGAREEGRDLGERDATRARDRKTVRAARDRREGQAGQPAPGGQRQRVAITRRQQGVLVVGAAMPDRAHGVDDEARRQRVAAREAHLAGGAAAEPTALLEQSGPGRAVDSAVHSAAAKQARVRGVHDRVHVEAGDVVAPEADAPAPALARVAHASTLRTMSQRPSAPRSASTARLNARWSRRFWIHRPMTKPASAMPVSATDVAANAVVSRPYHATAPIWTSL